jgi:hypothetical protein
VTRASVNQLTISTYQLLINAQYPHLLLNTDQTAHIQAKTNLHMPTTRGQQREADMEVALKTFFSSPRFAVAGASSDPSKYGHKSMQTFKAKPQPFRNAKNPHLFIE